MIWGLNPPVTERAKMGRNQPDLFGEEAAGRVQGTESSESGNGRSISRIFQRVTSTATGARSNALVCHRRGVRRLQEVMTRKGWGVNQNNGLIRHRQVYLFIMQMSARKTFEVLCMP